ncbi:MAG: hypothetical protein ACYTG0_34660 [Planctomycetota bacterium]|jgi:hypothetical protein
MKEWLRRIRGAIGMGLTWAAAWSPIGAIIGLVLGSVLGGVPLGAVVLRNVATFAMLGFVGGASFSTVLRITEGRRRFDELSLPRFITWGALGGFLLGVLAISLELWGSGFTLLGAIVAGATTLLGAGSAASSLALARRSDDDELLEAGEEASGAELTETEKQRLLGSTG